MTNKNQRKLLEIIENEGFDYTFADFSDFSEIKDQDFHNLRMAYLLTRKKLMEYIGFEE